MNEMKDYLFRLLGCNVKDATTGFTGTATAFTFYRNGEDPQILINSLDSTGRPVYEWVTIKNIIKV